MKKGLEVGQNDARKWDKQGLVEEGWGGRKQHFRQEFIFKRRRGSRGSAARSAYLLRSIPVPPPDQASSFYELFVSVSERLATRLLEALFRYFEEQLIDVDVFLCRRFKIGDVVLLGQRPAPGA